jgi:hypothetical protein
MRNMTGARSAPEGRITPARVGPRRPALRPERRPRRRFWRIAHVTSLVAAHAQVKILRVRYIPLILLYIL